MTSRPEVNSLAKSRKALVLARDVIEQTAMQSGIRVQHLAHSVGGHSSGVNSIAMTPDANIVVTCDDQCVKAWIWDGEAGHCFLTYEGMPRGFARHVALTENGKRMYAANQQNPNSSIDVQVWDIRSGRQIKNASSLEVRYGFVLARNGRLVYVDKQGNLVVWDLESGNVTRGFGQLQENASLRRGDAAGTLVAWCTDQQIHLFDLLNKERWTIQPRDIARVNSFSLSGSGNTLVICGLNYMCEVWDVRSRELRFACSGIGSLGPPPHFSVQGDYLTAVDRGRDRARIWDLRICGEVMLTPRVRIPIGALILSDNGRYLAIGRFDGTVELWDVKDTRQMGILGDRSRGIYLPVLDTKTTGFATVHITSGHLDNEIVPQRLATKLWDLSTLQCTARVDCQTSLQPPPRGSLAGGIMTEHRAGEIALRHLRTGRLVMTTGKDHYAFDSTCLNHDGHRLLATDRDNTAALWDLQSQRRPIMRFIGHSSGVTSVSLSKDGKTAATGSWGCAKTWDVSTGRCTCTIHISKPSTVSVWLSSDGRILATGMATWGKQPGPHVGLWAVPTRQSLRSISDPSWFRDGSHSQHSGVSYIFLTDDARRLVTVGFNEEAQIWDLEESRCIRRIQTHSHGGPGVSGASRLLMTQVSQDKLCFWDIWTGCKLATFHDLDEGFLWTTPPDRVSATGWFATNRTELVHVIECDQDGGNPRALPLGHLDREAYVQYHNRLDIVTARINDPARYEQLLGPLEPNPLLIGRDNRRQMCLPGSAIPELDDDH